MRFQRSRLFFFFSLLLPVAMQAQRQTVQPPPPPPSPSVQMQQIPVTAGDEARQDMARALAKKANLARQAALKTDTDKLLNLAEELKQDVEKSNENVLSLDVVKKAEEIEKLARSVKEKMKGPS